MIDGYKNISTEYYLLGLKPIDAAALVIIIFIPLVIGWWLIALLTGVAGYKLAKKYRQRHWDWVDLFIYLSQPQLNSIKAEEKYYGYEVKRNIRAGQQG